MTSLKDRSRRGGPSLIQVFAANLRRARRKRRMSISELARRCRYTPEYVRSVEAAMIPELSLAEVETLADALGVELANLLKPGDRS